MAMAPAVDQEIATINTGNLSANYERLWLSKGFNTIFIRI